MTSAISRRSFIRAGVAALAASGGMSSIGFGAPVKPPIGLQLFSLDEQMKQDLESTLAQVRAIGYRRVELVGYYGRSAKALRAALDAADLKCNSIHLRPHGVMEGIASLAENPDPHLAICRDLGMRYLVIPGPWLPERIARTLPSKNGTLDDVVKAVAQFTDEDWSRSADLVDRLGVKTKSNGMQLLYHNGNVEFAGAAGNTGYDKILRLTHPDHVKLELDCGWVRAAGYDPIKYIRAQKHRVRLIHIKDMIATPPNNAMQLNPAELGRGIVDWPPLLAAAVEAHVECAYVEQEAPFAHPAIESARINYQFLLTQ